LRWEYFKQRRGRCMWIRGLDIFTRMCGFVAGQRWLCLKC